jgi:hypothetical protein
LIPSIVNPKRMLCGSLAKSGHFSLMKHHPITTSIVKMPSH